MRQCRYSHREYCFAALLAILVFLSICRANAGAQDKIRVGLGSISLQSVEAMQAVVAQIAESNPKARGVDAKSYVDDRYLRRLEDEGFVKKVWGK